MQYLIENRNSAGAASPIERRRVKFSDGGLTFLNTFEVVYRKTDRSMRSRISRGSEHPFLGDDGQRYRHLPRRCVSLLFLIQHGELLPQVNQESLGVRSQPRRPPE